MMAPSRGWIKQSRLAGVRGRACFLHFTDMSCSHLKRYATYHPNGGYTRALGHVPEPCQRDRKLLEAPLAVTESRRPSSMALRDSSPGSWAICLQDPCRVVCVVWFTTIGRVSCRVLKGKLGKGDKGLSALFRSSASSGVYQWGDKAANAEKIYPALLPLLVSKFSGPLPRGLLRS